jgi:hypothetical protein
MAQIGEKIGMDRGEEIVDTGRCANAICDNHTYLPRGQYDKLRESGATFYCQAGHAGRYTPKKETDAKERRLREAERLATEAREAQEAALKAMRKAERTCTWPTCGAVLRSPKMLRQHMVDVHGAPWATPEVSAEEIGQVLNGRNQTEVVQ